MFRVGLVLGFAALLSGCATIANLDFGACPAPGTHATYFGDREFDSEFYVEMLAAAHEPSLSCGSGPREAYRLVMTRWGQPDVAVIAYSTAVSRLLRVVELNNDGEGNRHVIRSRTRYLAYDEWDDIRAAAASEGFWELPTERPLRSCVLNDDDCRDIVILDAPLILLEGRADRYHVVDDFTRGDVQRMREALLTAARLD